MGHNSFLPDITPKQVWGIILFIFLLNIIGYLMDNHPGNVVYQILWILAIIYVLYKIYM